MCMASTDGMCVKKGVSGQACALEGPRFPCSAMLRAASMLLKLGPGHKDLQVCVYRKVVCGEFQCTTHCIHYSSRSGTLGVAN